MNVFTLGSWRVMVTVSVDVTTQALAPSLLVSSRPEQGKEDDEQGHGQPSAVSRVQQYESCARLSGDLKLVRRALMNLPGDDVLPSSSQLMRGGGLAGRVVHTTEIVWKSLASDGPLMDTLAGRTTPVRRGREKEKKCQRKSK